MTELSIKHITDDEYEIIIDDANQQLLEVMVIAYLEDNCFRELINDMNEAIDSMDSTQIIFSN